MKDKLLAIAQTVLSALVILAGAIAVPILCRPFFYQHIVPLGLADNVGLTVQQVKVAYNEMMDFCTGMTDAFSTGALPFSQSGADHFADVRKLFVLDLRVLVIGVLVLIVVMLWRRKNPVLLVGHTPGFWSAAGLGVLFLMIGGLVALDFDRAFMTFHKLFFPGKSNWIFDPLTDPVILMLPEEFFRNCAIVILVLTLISCVGLLLYDRVRRMK